MNATEEKGKKDRGQKERRAECLPIRCLFPMFRTPTATRPHITDCQQPRRLRCGKRMRGVGAHLPIALVARRKISREMRGQRAVRPGHRTLAEPISWPIMRISPPRGVKTGRIATDAGLGKTCDKALS